jgi:methylmalonyl-CoA mutase C-terminal domain/subunit
MRVESPIRLRVLLAKPTADCHDRGVRYLARKCRDAGFEVIFMNFLLPVEIVNAAVQEDVQVVGVSSSSGGHMAVFQELSEGMRQNRMDDVLLLAGGVIPDEDQAALRSWGVRAVFGPGTTAEEAIALMRAHQGSESR